MSNNLERHIAVVLNPASGDRPDQTKLGRIIAEFECRPQYFNRDDTAQIASETFDAILFDDIDIDIERTPHLEQILIEMNDDFKPIAVIGHSANTMKKIFGDALELAGDKKTPGDDYISDRDFKVLSTTGTDTKGIRRMLRELIEMA